MYTNEAICALLPKYLNLIDTEFLYPSLAAVNFEQEIDQAVKGKTLNKDKESARFLDAVRSHRLYALFCLAMSTGMRRGEVLGVRWGDIEGHNLYVRQTVIECRGSVMLSTPKTKKGERRLTLSSDVLEVLAEHRKRQEAEARFLSAAWPNTGLVFTSTVGSFIPPRNMLQTYKELQERAGVPHVRFHDLRHLNVSIRRAQGQDAKLIADQVGHADPAFTMRQYAHLFETERQTAAVNLRDALSSKQLTEVLN